MSNIKLTGKQLAFCEGVVRGDSLSDSYRAAYNADKMAPASIHANASKLATDTRIALRIEVLREEKRRAEYTLDTSDRQRSLDRLRQLVDNALSEQVRLNAAVWLGKTSALFTDVIETRDKRRSPDEIRAEIDRLLADDKAEAGTDDMATEADSLH